MAADEDVALRAWEREQPDAITKDPLWTLNCYREALCLIDAARADVHRLGEHPALVGEGYGRMSAADRAKFLSYALGAAREAITWYRALVPPIGDL